MSQPCLYSPLVIVALLASTGPVVAGTDPVPALPGAASSAVSASESASPETQAETDPGIVPGRPGFTESRGVVPVRAVQFEAGYGLARDTDDSVQSQQHAWPGVVVRTGLTPRLELRVAGFGVLTQRDRFFDNSPTTRATAASDVQVGFKAIIASEEHFPLELSLIPMVSVPVGGAPFSSGELDPNVTLAFGRALPHGFDLTGLARAASLTADGAREMQYSASVLVSRDIAPGWNAFGEAFYVTGAGADRQWNMDVGLARRLTRLIQLDVSVGHSINEAAPDWTVSTGVVFRK